MNPDDWGWASGSRPEDRRSLDEIRGLPGFTVTVRARPDLQFLPGPKPKRPKKRREWPQGAAPAAMALSKGGASDGTSGRYDRLSDALGYAAWTLPRNPQSNPFHVWDLIAGRLIEIAYEPLPPPPGGEGSVYLVEGRYRGEGWPHLWSSRRAALQTGNPRLIGVVAMVSAASESVERPSTASLRTMGHAG